MNTTNSACRRSVYVAIILAGCVVRAGTAFAKPSFQTAAGSVVAPSSTSSMPAHNLSADVHGGGGQEGHAVDARTIKAGFVFMDGQYIDAPYVLTVKGGDVCVNDIVVDRYYLVPQARPVPETDPQLPASIVKETSLHDPVLGAYLADKRAYVRAHKPEQEAQAMEDVLRSLPLTKEARRTGIGRLEIVTHSGEKATIALMPPRRPYTTKSESERAEEAKLHYETGLLEGRCYFFSSKGGMRMVMSHSSVVSTLPHVVAVLRSGRSDDEKIQAVNEAGLGFVRKGTEGEKLVTQFSASPQLEKRLEEVVKASHQ